MLGERCFLSLLFFLIYFFTSFYFSFNDFFSFPFSPAVCLVGGRVYVPLLVSSIPGTYV